VGPQAARSLAGAIGAQAGWSEKTVDDMVKTYGHSADGRRLDDIDRHFAAQRDANRDATGPQARSHTEPEQIPPIPRAHGPRTIIGIPPRGESVGIWRIESRRSGSASSRRKRRRIERAIALTSSCPKRIPMQVRDPPPNGT
jgi:hypothetical protein